MIDRKFQEKISFYFYIQTILIYIYDDILFVVSLRGRNSIMVIPWVWGHLNIYHINFSSTAYFICWFQSLRINFLILIFIFKLSYFYYHLFHGLLISSVQGFLQKSFWVHGLFSNMSFFII